MIDSNTLGDFLRTRRAKVSPADVGLPTGARRRVSGLRREELAQLAGISVEYYQRLEQGRANRPSDEVLGALATILGLNEVEHAHLHRLAYPPRNMTAPSLVAQQPFPSPDVRPELSRMLALMDRVPAMVINDMFDVLAMNDPARALFADVATMPESERNLARYLFCSPSSRDFYVEWGEVAAVTVAQLRVTAGRFPCDTQAAALIAELSEAAPEFRRLWDDGDVEVRTHGAKPFRHPTLGVLRLSYENFDLAGSARQRIVAFTAEPDGRSWSGR
ncbi:helix-turn-helix transcriptional regulator [Nocardia heshunensis]